MPREGFEPPTPAPSTRRSTAELPWQDEGGPPIPPARLERATSWFVARRSAPLSYGGVDRTSGREWIRTTVAREGSRVTAGPFQPLTHPPRTELPEILRRDGGSSPQSPRDLGRNDARRARPSSRRAPSPECRVPMQSGHPESHRDLHDGVVASWLLDDDRR